jgi:hypothetical protein
MVDERFDWSDPGPIENEVDGLVFLVKDVAESSERLDYVPTATDQDVRDKLGEVERIYDSGFSNSGWYDLVEELDDLLVDRVMLTSNEEQMTNYRKHAYVERLLNLMDAEGIEGSNTQTIRDYFGRK